MTRGQTRDKVLRRDAFELPSSLPTKTRCVQVEIPDDFEYEVLLYSVLQILCKWNSYQQDGAHRAADVAYLWRQALKLTDCVEDNGASCGIEIEDEMRLRVDPDNSCILQIECKPGEWETFWDISECVTTNVRQAINGTPLEPDQCVNWDVALHSWDKWLLPVSVNSGDKLVISGAQGATNDGTLLTWYCPDGQNFVLGVCSGGESTSGSDPAPTLNHQRLIVSIDGVFYDAYNTTIIVPTGVTDAQVFFQINTATLVGNAGSLSFNVEACNAGLLRETLTIPATNGTGVSTSFNTDPDKLYKITLSGVCSAAFSASYLDDAFYYSTNSWATHARLDLGSPTVCDTNVVEVCCDGEPFPTPAYNSDHEYVVYRQGTGAPFNFVFCDQSTGYPDNSGTLTAVVEL